MQFPKRQKLFTWLQISKVLKCMLCDKFTLIYIQQIEPGVSLLTTVGLKRNMAIGL